MNTLTIAQMAHQLHNANNTHKDELIEDLSYDTQVMDTIDDLTSQITDMLNGDLDLNPVATFITKTGDSITLHKPINEVIGELQRVKAMSKGPEHIAHYKSLNLTHDGADDFDFGGSYYYLLINLLKAIQ